MNLIEALFCTSLVKLHEQSNPTTELAHRLHRAFW